MLCYVLYDGFICVLNRPRGPFMALAGADQMREITTWRLRDSTYIWRPRKNFENGKGPSYSLRLAETFSTFPLKPPNGFQQNLTGSKARSQSPLPSLCFSGWSVNKCPLWLIPQKGGTLYSGARYVALWASCFLGSWGMNWSANKPIAWEPLRSSCNFLFRSQIHSQWTR